MRLWSLSLPAEARWIGNPAHCCRPLQQDEMTCQKRVGANKRMKPTPLAVEEHHYLRHFPGQRLTVT